MRRSDLRYIRPIRGIDSGLVGTLLGAGVHHRVYAYGEKSVIKIPRRRFAFLYSTHSHLTDDLTLIKKHFPGLAVATRIFSSANGKRHCMVQDRIDHPIQLTQRTIALVQEEFLRLHTRNAAMLAATGMSLDIVGGEGVESCLRSLVQSKEAYSSNMVIKKSGKEHKLVLVDTELMRLHLPAWNTQDITRYFLSLGSFLCMRVCLRFFFCR